MPLARWTRTLAAVALTAGAGCGADRGEPPRPAEASALPAPATFDCTLMGGASALRVRIPGVPETESVHVEAVAVGPPPPDIGADSARAAGACAGAACAAGLDLPEFAPDTAVLTVRTPRGTTRRRVVPAYRPFRPNGPGCPPALRVGLVVLPLAP